MENRDAQNSQQDPTISQQNQQQPTDQQNQQSATGEAAPQSGGAFDSQQPSETGQADTGQSGQSDTLTQQRSDTEGSASQSSEQGAQAPGFIGQTGGTDPSSELVEDSQDFDKDGQGSIEGE